MDFITNNADLLNWWAIIGATLSTLPIGYVWYDLKIGFGRRWAKLNGLKTSDLQKSDGMAATFAAMLATSFVTAFLLGCLIWALEIDGLWNGLVFGLIIGLVFRGGAHFIHNGFTRKSPELSLIDAGHDMVSIAVIAAILGVWV